MFWKKKIRSPITQDDEILINQYFDWILDSFGETILLHDVITPYKFQLTGEVEDTEKILKLLCQIMEIDRMNLNLKYYQERKQVELGDSLITQYSDDTKLSTGQYVEHADGVVEIWVEETQIQKPQSLVATLSHELSHFKLLHEERINENDEYLTDILIVFFGLGIFSANSSIAKMDTWSTSSGAGWQIKGAEGYLHYKVWSFVLAKHSLLTRDLQPTWINFLEPDILKNFRKSIDYLLANEQ